MCVFLTNKLLNWIDYMRLYWWMSKSLLSQDGSTWKRDEKTISQPSHFNGPSKHFIITNYDELKHKNKRLSFNYFTADNTSKRFRITRESWRNASLLVDHKELTVWVLSWQFPVSMELLVFHQILLIRLIMHIIVTLWRRMTH